MGVFKAGSDFLPKLLAQTDDTSTVSAGKCFYKEGVAMDHKEYFEQTATTLAALDRDELKNRIRNFRGRFKLDFTEDYLNKLTVDRLRHILLAALISTSPHS